MSLLLLQTDFQIDGARLFDIDSSSNIFVFARRLPVMGGMHVLTKVSFSRASENEFVLILLLLLIIIISCTL